MLNQRVINCLLIIALQKRSVRRIKWTEMEIQAIKKHFDIYKLPKLPTLTECRNLIQQNKCLRRRTPEQLKSWIDNQRKNKIRKKKYLLNRTPLVHRK